MAQAIAREGWEGFERPLPFIFYRSVQVWPGLILDVGANTGLYTLVALAAHARNRVVAFEPMPNILAALDENLRDNGLEHRVRLIRCALGDRNGAAHSIFPQPGTGGLKPARHCGADFKPSHSAVLEVLQRTDSIGLSSARH